MTQTFPIIEVPKYAFARTWFTRYIYIFRTIPLHFYKTRHLLILCLIITINAVINKYFHFHWYPCHKFHNQNIRRFFIFTFMFCFKILINTKLNTFLNSYFFTLQYTSISLAFLLLSIKIHGFSYSPKKSSLTTLDGIPGLRSFHHDIASSFH